jgi:hypothetical protein
VNPSSHWPAVEQASALRARSAGDASRLSHYNALKFVKLSLRFVWMRADI